MKNEESKIGECYYTPHEPPTQEELMAPANGTIKGIMNLKEQKTMTVDQIIEVLQAWKEKKPLQYRLPYEDQEWQDYTTQEVPEGFRHVEWRVKPEQRKPWKGWVLLRTNGEHTAHETDKFLNLVEGRIIRVIEVMDDEDERPTETEDNRKVWLRTDLVEEDYASLSVLPNFDSKDEPAYFYYASELRKHPELRKYVIGG